MRSVLYDVYKCLSVSGVLKFFTRDEKNWSDYLQRQDVFSPKAFSELQHKQQATLDTLLREERKAMKRFLTILLFAIIFAVLFFSIGGLVSLCCGAEPMHITISKPLPFQPTPYPFEIYSMTDIEFFKWATDQNIKARVKWEEWFKTASLRWISYSATDYKRHHRNHYFDSGYERNTNYERHYRSRYSDSGYERGSTRRYERHFLNPDYHSWPLIIINPYYRPILSNHLSPA